MLGESSAKEGFRRRIFLQRLIINDVRICNFNGRFLKGFLQKVLIKIIYSISLCIVKIQLIFLCHGKILQTF